jgi:hypothetical protein
MKMDHLEYAKHWIKRPVFQGVYNDRLALQNMVNELEFLRSVFDNPVAWAKINDGGDLYDLRLQNNPYNDQNKIVPLYRLNND